MLYDVHVLVILCSTFSASWLWWPPPEKWVWALSERVWSTYFITAVIDAIFYAEFGPAAWIMLDISWESTKWILVSWVTVLDIYEVLVTSTVTATGPLCARSCTVKFYLSYSVARSPFYWNKEEVAIEGETSLQLGWMQNSSNLTTGRSFIWLLFVPFSAVSNLLTSVLTIRRSEYWATP